MGIHLKRAIFLDRDGTLNTNIVYPDTGAAESPRTPEELALLPGVTDALLKLQRAGFLLFIVSNQPNAAKGKSTMEQLLAINEKMQRLLASAGITLTESYYCYHHPDFTGPCQCRKPSPYFLLEAAKKYGLELQASWMVGDRDTDIECGKRAGVKTLKVGTDGVTLANSVEKLL